MTTINRPTTQARDAQIILGIQKNLQHVSSLSIGGTTFTPDALVKLVQGHIDLINAIAASRATWHSQVVSGQALSAQLTPILRGLRQYVINANGETSPVLADFGFTAPKKRVLTPDEKAAAAVKAKATRKARNTMGKVQKKNVKGTVTAIVASSDASKASQPVAPAPVASAPTTSTSGGTTPHGT
jgi:hypothetical protein